MIAHDDRSRNASAAPPSPAARRIENIRQDIESRSSRWTFFFTPAFGAPGTLEQLWKKTLSAYLENPIPPRFKEKLFAYLSRFSKASYSVVFHTSSLHSLGLGGREILLLLGEPLEILEADVAALSCPLVADGSPLKDWPETPSEAERALFGASVAVFMKTGMAARCRLLLRRLLGPLKYGRLLALLAYIRTSLQWVEAHPELTIERDPDLSAEAKALTEAVPGLGEFFRTYRDRVKRELTKRVQERSPERGAASEGLDAADSPASNHRRHEGTTILRVTNEGLLDEVAERKRIEEELRGANEALENAVEGISRVNLEGEFLSTNRAFAELLGRAPGEMRGVPWVSFVHPEDREKAHAAHRRMMDRGKSHGVVRALGRDGPPLYLDLVFVKALDPARATVGFHLFGRDVSERIEAEHERNRLTAQLFQGQKLQALGQLAAGVAHEINNPLAFILSNFSSMRRYCRDLSDLVRKAVEIADRAAVHGEEDADLGSYRLLRKESDLDFILGDLDLAIDANTKGVERIRDIVRSLREFSHADVGKPEPTNLIACLEDALRICSNELKYKAEVIRDFETLPSLVCYPQRLGQAFVNLLVNAAQAIEKRGTITLSTRVEGGQAVIRIRDTGTGIPAENLGKIFEPFFTTKPVGQGTGLGLHVVYKVIQAHRGTIDVSSQVGKGTEFIMRIPIGGTILEGESHS